MPFLNQSQEWNDQDDITTDGAQSAISRLTLLNYNSKLRDKLIEDFYKHTDKKIGDLDAVDVMRTLILTAEEEKIELTETQKQNLMNLVSVPKPRQKVIDIQTKFGTLGSLAPIQEELLGIADYQEDDFSLASPTISVRNNRYQTMSTVLSAFKDAGNISEKQYYIFTELYAHEDLPLLAAFEVQDYTKDANDFLETLDVIEKQEFVNPRIKGMEKFIDGSDVMGTQLKTLYRFKAELGNKVFSALSKCVHSNDIVITGQIGNFRQELTSKDSFLAFQIEYGEEKHKAFSELDRKERLEKKRERKDWRIPAKRTVENYLFQHGIENTPTESFLMNAIESDNEIMKSIMKVHDKNNDKGDFYENLKLYGAWGVLNANPDLKQWEDILTRSGTLTQANINNALNVFADPSHKMYSKFVEAKELYEVMDDEEDFCSTILAWVKKMR